MCKYKCEKKWCEKCKKCNGVNFIFGFGLCFIMIVRNVFGIYNQIDGIFLLGYNQELCFFGFNLFMSGDLIGFIFGQQLYSVIGCEIGYNFVQVVGNNNWIVQNLGLNCYYMLIYQQIINGCVILEFIKDVFIDLMFNCVYGQNMQDFYCWNEDLGVYQF